MKGLRFFFCQVLFFLFLLPASGYAEDQTASDIKKEQTAQSAEVKPDETVIKAVPQESSPVIRSAPEEKSPVISQFESNHVASRAVERNLSLFSNRIRDKFSLWLSRSGQYLEIMKNILRKKDVPEDIVFLSLIESGFNPYAYSIARAVGPWQFIASTAKRYGLEINWWKDERRDPIKSTEAAADYLKDLYGMFGSWNLAMAAYNAGEGKILRAVQKSKSEDYWDLLRTRHIKNETKEYVPKFIAASIIASNPADFGFENIEYSAPFSYDEVELDRPIDLAVAADCAGTDMEAIKKLNPELRRWCTPPDVTSYKLRIPAGSKEEFLEKLSAIPENERLTIDHYTVRNGDTFKKIAQRTGIPLSIILSVNAMEKIMPLTVGETIYLPPKHLLTMDQDDRAAAKKASFKNKKKRRSGRSAKKRSRRA